MYDVYLFWNFLFTRTIQKNTDLFQDGGLHIQIAGHHLSSATATLSQSCDSPVTEGQEYDDTNSAPLETSRPSHPSIQLLGRTQSITAQPQEP